MSVLDGRPSGAELNKSSATEPVRRFGVLGAVVFRASFSGLPRTSLKTCSVTRFGSTARKEGGKGGADGRGTDSTSSCTVGKGVC